MKEVDDLIYVDYVIRFTNKNNRTIDNALDGLEMEIDNSLLYEV